MFSFKSIRFIFFCCFLSFLVCFNVTAADNSLNDILNAINKLESKSEPKCYATASRLEDFMFGTPLADDARFAKNILQKQLIKSIWIKASELAKADNEDIILKSHISQVVKQFLNIAKDENQHWLLSFENDLQLTIHKDDKRQYASIAYSLRAVLAVQQEALLDFKLDLLPLTENAIDAVKGYLDFYTLAVLKVTDNKAKVQNEKLVTVKNMNTVWQSLANFNTSSRQDNSIIKQQYQRIDPVLLKKMADKKLNSYAAYNKINNQLFLRNLQVYFARVTWPKNEDESSEIISDFGVLLTEFSASLYSGAQKNAMSRNQLSISEKSVHEFAKKFIPHEVNEYEDVLFFPKLNKNQQVYLESYDMDAFRDSGVHWQYLMQAVLAQNFKTYIEPDPFAAELMVENIAQYGVLLLRVAGEQAKLKGHKYLKPEHLILASNLLAKKVNLHKVVKVKNIESIKITSSNNKQSTKSDFSDITTRAGIAFEHKSSDWLNRQLRSFIKKDESTGIITIPPAFGGSGVATEDINNDGFIDILLLGGRGNKLFINDGKGVFEDKTQAFGLNWVRAQDSHPGEVRQPLIADINNDGWQDIIITYVNDTHRIYKNINGKRFEDVSQVAQLGGDNLVGGPATLFDFDNDGDLDIYITYFGNYIKGDLPTLKRRNSNGSPNQLFENLGDFKFENVTKNSGLDNSGWAQAVAHTDLNNDGWQDVIVGNDFGVNAYYINQKNGKFIEVSEQLGTDKPSYTMGIGITDLNGDLTPDIYVSNIVTMNKDETYVLPNQDTLLKFNADKLAHMKVIEANDLFISTFDNIDLQYQMSFDIGRGYSSTGWSWDADFFDYDLDGDDDLYVLNGMNEFNIYSNKNPYFTDSNDQKRDVILPKSAKEENVFFENRAGKLNNESKKSGLNLLSNSRSASYFDRDNDGDLDIIINNYHEPAVLFDNNLKRDDRNWLKVKLIGKSSLKVTKDAIGAKVIATLPNGNTIWHEVRSTDGYMSVHPKEQHFGLGDFELVDLKIIWPNGDVKELKHVKTNQRLVIEM